MLKRTLIIVTLLSSLGGVARYAVAEIVVRVAPPPPRSELVPAARRGHIWSPGHWEWRRQQHIWVGGSWLRERPGYAYQAPAWSQRDGRWAMQPGRWARGERDGYNHRSSNGGNRDHNGVPNRRDRDRDGDGVPNHRDARPNNPNLR